MKHGRTKLAQPSNLIDDRLPDALEAEWKEHGSGITDPQQLRQTRIPLGTIYTAPRTFQPRETVDKYSGDLPQDLEEHIEYLTEALKQRGSEGLRPVMLFSINGKRFLIDGHCRYAAYWRAGWKASAKIPVRYFVQRERKGRTVDKREATFEDALSFSGAANSENKLAMTTSEKTERAWLLVKFTALSVRKIAKDTGISKNTVQTMRDALKRPGAETLREMTWKEIKRGEREPQPDWEEKLEAAAGRALKKAWGNQPNKNPATFAHAFRNTCQRSHDVLIEEAADEIAERAEQRREEIRNERESADF